MIYRHHNKLKCQHTIKPQQSMTSSVLIEMLLHTISTPWSRNIPSTKTIVSDLNNAHYNCSNNILSCIRGEHDNFMRIRNAYNE